MDELEAFVDFIAPASGQFVSHVSLSLMEESPNALNRWLLVYPRLPPLLPNISVCAISRFDFHGSLIHPRRPLANRDCFTDMPLVV